jgi:hypothetical protein
MHANKFIMTKDELFTELENIHITEDSDDFAASAKNRLCQWIPEIHNEDWQTELKRILVLEIDFLEKESQYYSTMTPYYHENMSTSRQFEAQFLRKALALL